MKFFVIVLLILGFIGPVFGQGMGDISDKIWLPNCPTGTSIECDQSSLFPDAIAFPFFQSDSVAIGTVVEKNSQNQDSIRYSLDVDFYLKNYQPFDLLTATLNNATEPQTFPDVLYYNSPVFSEGDLVFVYLEKTDGQYKLLPESFALDKHEVRGPPPTIHLTKSPSEDVVEQGDEILVSGEVRKMELVKATKEGKRVDARLMLVDPDDRNNIIFSDLMKIESDGSYNYILDTSKIPPTKYELEVNYGPSTFGTEITIEPNFKIWTPIKQHKFGISHEEIQCRENLVVIQKYDGSPACVKTESREKLIERGWANLNPDKIRNTVSLPSPPDPMSITITGNDKLPIFSINRGETKEIGILLEPKIPIISATVAVDSYFGSAGNCNNINNDNYCPGRGIIMNLTDTKITAKKEITLTISIPENMAVGTYGYQIETKTTFDMPSVEKTRTVGNSLRFDLQVK